MISQNYTITLPYPLVTPHTSENIRAYTLKTENKRFCKYGYYTAPTIPQKQQIINICGQTLVWTHTPAVADPITRP